MEDAEGRYPKRIRRQTSDTSTSSPGSTSSDSSSGSGSSSGGGGGGGRGPPTGRVLVVHANVKEYGRGAKGSKESNRRFDFSASDYLAMRDSGRPYPAHRNPLLPLPRPTYTEFVNRARRARMLDRLDFLFVAPDAPQPPRASEVNYGLYERVVWSGVSFRRFAKLWTPERHCFFKRDFRNRVFALLLSALRHRSRSQSCGLDDLPEECLNSILAYSASEKDSVIDGYDSIATIHAGAHHVFVPAPGSSGIREALFDAVFGL